MRKSSTLFKLILIYRIFNAFLTKTFFQADEFWQSLEPAHLKAFGYGNLTWEWNIGLRSYAFPFIFELGYRSCSIISSCIYFILSTFDKILLSIVLQNKYLKESNFLLGILKEFSLLTNAIPQETGYLLVLYVPKLIMAFISSIGEYYTVMLAYKIYNLTFAKEDKNRNGPTIIKIITILTLTNFFNNFFITRTFINSFEMSLTSIALYYWDWSFENLQINQFSFSLSMFISMFTILQRPTNGFIWLWLGIHKLYQLLSNRKWMQILRIVNAAIKSFSFALALNCLIDYYFYGHLTFPVFKFIKFNFTSSLSKFYGQAPWNFHIFQSVPIILGYNLPLFLYGMITPLYTGKDNRHIFKLIKFIILMNIIVYSMISHKEFRFIYPLQPFFQIISTFALFKLTARYKLNLNNNFFWILPTISTIAALFLCRVQEGGVMDVMYFFHSIKGDITSVGFIMPCHSTPWQSHLHKNNIQDLWYITCEPPLHLLEDTNSDKLLLEYMDESDYLYDNIQLFLYQNFPPVYNKGLRSPGKQYLHEWPEFLVIFQHLDDEFMKQYLEDSPYFEYTRFSNSFIHWDSRRSGDVVVYHKRPWA
ncbi:putative glycosylphosphatidylinositol-alpha 1,2 mannosyltransferase SCDLUD_002700 [Saccharomycodes ludwigii]|uniref:putative glycosylphosphatidylinositol-alpha 1,2 mannosyltransferase n=1 Tax=Saccharomycodes ludwigii TaxID=36035 RepID=UPI001E8B0BEB|nr:hypothetical protein SCDLUD_002700 [Saccharomycodes ludwigii]KAH3901214.1 hypothetical protein SCDLUD_002700 [Saccharomycodes ludwigii]